MLKNTDSAGLYYEIIEGVDYDILVQEIPNTNKLRIHYNIKPIFEPLNIDLMLSYKEWDIIEFVVMTMSSKTDRKISHGGFRFECRESKRVTELNVKIWRI